MNFIFRGRGRRRTHDENARLRRELRTLTVLDGLARRQIKGLVEALEDERERRRTAERQCELAEGLVTVKEEELAAARARHRQMWEQVKTRPPVPYSAKVTVVGAGIPVVLPVKPVKPPMDVPRWAPKAETLAETTQPIPLAQREPRQTSWGAHNQDAETTQELPLPQPQTAAT